MPATIEAAITELEQQAASERDRLLRQTVKLMPRQSKGGMNMSKTSTHSLNRGVMLAAAMSRLIPHPSNFHASRRTCLVRRREFRRQAPRFYCLWNTVLKRPLSRILHADVGGLWLLCARVCLGLCCAESEAPSE